MTARTHNELFESWRDSQPVLSWKEHLAESNNQLLKRYEELGFRVIPLGEKSKRPIDDWVEIHHTWLYLFSHLSQKGNIGIVAGLSKPSLVVLDYDEEILPEKVERACKGLLVSVSPNGYHIFLRGPYHEKRFDLLKAAFPKFDLARAGHGYVVVPPSMTCKNEHSKHPCEELKEPHQYRMHEWIEINAPILSFREFVKKCLT